MKFQIDRTKYIDSGLISERFHPEFPLAIYNYTSLTQYSQAWDEVTMMCRGLIVNTETSEVVARPFPKFFNYEEHVGAGRAIPDEQPCVFKKVDGSLGIMYWFDHHWHIATRGSFDSPQAKWATKKIQSWDLHHLWIPNWTQDTLLWEIIFPENRIVVDYKGWEGLVYLGRVNIESGRSTYYNNELVSMQSRLIQTPDGFIQNEELDFSPIDDLSALNTKNEEGFVLWYPKADLRLKIKFEDYKRLHKLYTGLNSIAVWEWLRDGFDPYTQDVPGEMLPWLESVVNRLNQQFNEIEHQAEQTLGAAHGLPTRKEQASVIQMGPQPSIAFAMLDGKDYSKAIWRMLRPKGAEVFRTDIDQ